MSVREEKSFSVWCDWPGCDYRFESCDYSIFSQGWDVDEIVTAADGRCDKDGKRHYCHQHNATWASDHEDGEPFPEPPYLLIHDGDTDNPIDDDGLVSLIEVAP